MGGPTRYAYLYQCLFLMRGRLQHEGDNILNSGQITKLSSQGGDRIQNCDRCEIPENMDGYLSPPSNGTVALPNTPGQEPHHQLLGT
jgi:hypothetical protein